MKIHDPTPGQTTHAKVRVQQRAISPFIIEALLDNGRRIPAGDGCEKVFLDKRSRRNLRRKWGTQVTKRLEDLLDVSVVVKDGSVVTAMHRTERIKRS